MPADNIISRTDAQALIPEKVSYDILKNLQAESAALSMFTSIPMSTAQTRMPVLSALPTAYFVNGDTGLKQTTEVDWTNKYLNVEELACIVPIPENVLDDVQFDAWGFIRPLLEQGIGRALDAAIFFGVNKPASWPDDIVTAATAAGNAFARGTTSAANGGLAGDINLVFAAVEAAGYDVNGVAANRTYRGLLRNVRSTIGTKLPEINYDDVWGVKPVYPMRGLWPTGAGAAELVAGDFTQGIIGKRSDMTYKILDQAVITDPVDGHIVFNLAQQDMVALRLTFRVAFQVANTLNYDQPDEAQRYPFGVLHAA